MPKISNLPAAAAAQVTDLVAAVQGGVTKKETLQQIVNLFGGTITISESQVTGLVADLASKFAIANNLSEGVPATMRTNLGLVIGTNVEAWSPALDSIAGLTTVANNLIYTTASNTYAVVAPVNNAVLVTSAGGVPSESTTLPSGLTIPGYAHSGANSDITSLTGLTGVIQAPTFINDSLGNPLMAFSSAGVGGNVYFTVLNGISPGGCNMLATGTGANLAFNLWGKGSSGINVLTPTGTSPLRLVPFENSNTFGLAFDIPAITSDKVATFRDLSGTVAYLSDIPAGSPAALTRVDDTNVTLTLGGTPATALLQAVSLTLGWTGQLGVGRGGTGLAALTAHNLIIGNGTSAATLLAPSATSGVPLISQGASADPAYGTAAIAGGGTGVTSVTTAPTASAFAGWDANRNLSADNFLSGYTTTATAAATTTLTVNDTYQQFFTGSTTQTVVLPVTSTLTLGHQFYIVNNSTGVVTVQSSGANTVQAMAASTTLLVTCINTGVTTAAGWSVEYVGAVSGGTVNAGTANQLAYYAGTGNAVSGLTTITNAQNGVTMTLKKGDGSTSYTTSSASYVAVDATNLAYTVTIPTGYKLQINASGSWTNGATAISKLALVDGSTPLQEVSGQNIGAQVTFSLDSQITGDGASHTIQLQYKCSAGTVLVLNSSTSETAQITFFLSPSN